MIHLAFDSFISEGDFLMKKLIRVFIVELFMMCLAATPGAAFETREVLTLYFGSGPREVGLFPPGAGTGGYVGPTSFVVDIENNYLILDAAHCSVKVFTPEGTLKQIIEYPPFAADGTPVLCVDLAVSLKGDIYLANQTENVIWKFSPDGTLSGTIGKKADGLSYFGFIIKVDVDSQGNVYGVDRKSLKVLKFSPDGKKDRALPFRSCSVTYPDGGLVILDISEKTNSLAVKRLTSDFSEVDHVATLKPPKSILDAYPIGIDFQQNLYLFTSLGEMHGELWKKVEVLYILAVGPDGKLKKKIEVPEFPAFPLNRHFAVTGDGRVLKVATDEERFRIIEYR